MAKNSEGSYQEPFPENKNHLQCWHPRIRTSLLVSPHVSVSCSQAGKGNRRQRGGVLFTALDMEMEGQYQDDRDRPAFRWERGKWGMPSNRISTQEPPYGKVTGNQVSRGVRWPPSVPKAGNTNGWMVERLVESHITSETKSTTEFLREGWQQGYVRRTLKSSVFCYKVPLVWSSYCTVP